MKRIMHRYLDIIVGVLITVGILCVLALHSSVFFNAGSKLYFREFLQSSNFSVLENDNKHALTYRTYGGTYNLGMPLPPQKETTYGTNRGSRILPLITFLTYLQKITPGYWDRVYLTLAIISPYIGLIIASRVFLKTNIYQRIFAGTLYAYNPWIFERLSTGFLQLHFAYAVLPVIFLGILYLWGLSNKKDVRLSTSLALIGLSSGIAYAFQPHFLAMLLPVLIGVCVIRLVAIPSKRLKTIILSVLLLLIMILVNGYHIGPSHTFEPFTVTRENPELNIGSIIFNSQNSTVKNLLQLSPVPEELTRSYNYIYILSGLFISGLLLYFNKSWRTLLIVLVTLFIAIPYAVFSLGANEPFREFNISLYKNIDLLRPFRDTTRMYSMVIFFITMAIMFIQVKKRKILHVILLITTISLFPSIYENSRVLSKKISFQNIPENRYEKFELSPVGPFENRTYVIPHNISLKNYSWMKSDAPGGIGSSSVETLIPLDTNLAHSTSFNDSYFSRLSLYTYNQLIQNEPVQPLLERLHISSILVEEETLKKNELVIDMPEYLKKKNSHNNISQYSLQNYPIYQSTKPIFLYGDMQSFTKLASMDTAPIIMLHQKINIESALDGNIKNHIIVFDPKYNIQEAFLTDLDEYSLRLDEIVFDHDNTWVLHEPQSKKDTLAGLPLSSGRSIQPRENGSTLSHTFNHVSGEYILAVKALSGMNASRIKISINDNSFTLNEKEDYITYEHPNYLDWYIFENVNIYDSNVITVSESDPVYTFIDDLLLIPTSEYISARNEYSDFIENNTVISIDEYSNASVPTVPEIEITDNYTFNISSQTGWATLPIPFAYGWETSDKVHYFISDYYGITLYHPKDFKDIVLRYEPEYSFRKYVNVSKITVFLLLSMLTLSYLHGLRNLKVIK